MITEETKSIINKGIDALLALITNSVYTGTTEHITPNSSEFYTQYDKDIQDAIDYLYTKLEGNEDV